MEPPAAFRRYSTPGRVDTGFFMGQPFRFGYFLPVTDPAHMADRIMLLSPASDAEALKLLRSSFPDQPLSMRVAALHFLMRRSPRYAGTSQA
jgi:hypothetical protein